MKLSYVTMKNFSKGFGTVNCPEKCIQRTQLKIH